MTRRPLTVLQPMQCDDGCGRCCAPAHASKREVARIRQYLDRKGLAPLDHEDPMRCPFFDGRGCSIYPVRPMVCRLFGHVPEMQCPRGYVGNRIPDAIARRLIRRGGKGRLLGEVFKP